MVAVEDAAIRGDEISSIVVILGGGSPAVVGMDELVLNVLGVEPVADEIRTDGREDEPDAVDRFAASYGEHPPAQPGDSGDEDPDRHAQRCPSLLTGSLLVRQADGGQTFGEV